MEKNRRILWGTSYWASPRNKIHCICPYFIGQNCITWLHLICTVAGKCSVVKKEKGKCIWWTVCTTNTVRIHFHTFIPDFQGNLLSKSVILSECHLSFPWWVFVLDVPRGLGLKVIGGIRVGLINNVASPCNHTMFDEDSAGSSNKRKFLFRLRKGAAFPQGWSMLFRFFVITHVPLFPNQFPKHSMKKDPEKPWIKHRLWFFSP